MPSPIPLYESNNYIYLCSKFTIVTMVVTFSPDQSTIDSSVHVLLYGVKLNSEIDIVRFIFTQCVVCWLRAKLSVIFLVTTNQRRLENIVDFKKYETAQYHSSALLLSAWV